MTGFERFIGRGPVPPLATGASTDPLRDPSGYRAGLALARAVNVALALRMPLLVTGEPGTGKTQLAYRMAAELGLGEVLRFDTKSSSQATDLFYQFDSVRQFGQSQIDAMAGRALPAPGDFIRFRALGEAILRTLPQAERPVPATDGAPRQSLVLIDEIDKAPRDFPNDLLNQIEDLEFEVPELGRTWRAAAGLAPVVLITSNSEKQLPEAFLRRCVYHHIEFPQGRDELEQILGARLARLELHGRAYTEALQWFFDLRDDATLAKKPSTSELLDWLRALSSAGLRFDLPLAAQGDVLETSLGSLMKTREDLERARSLLPAATAG